MIEGIEDIYQEIADATLKIIPTAWNSARIEAIFFPDSIDFEGEYVPDVGNPRSIDVGMVITRAFRALRRKFKEAGKPLWGQAVFELTADGKFKMTWGYDNCDNNGDTIWNEETWKRRQEERRHRLSR